MMSVRPLIVCLLVLLSLRASADRSLDGFLSSNPSAAVMYGELFHRVALIARQADEAERQGLDASSLRHVIRRYAGLDEEQGRRLELIARICERDVAALNPTVGQKELASLSQGVTNVILLARERLQSALGDEAFGRLDRDQRLRALRPIDEVSRLTGSEQVLTPAVRRPDHVVVLRDNYGTPKCRDKGMNGIRVRQLLLQIVDASNVPIDENIAIRETYDSRPLNTCTKRIIPAPSGCEPTGNLGPDADPELRPGRFLDTLTVAIDPCESGIPPSSNCGFKLEATWHACSHGFDNPFWRSTRHTRANGVTVNDNDIGYDRDTILR